MTLRQSIDRYLADMRALGRINSKRTEEAYFLVLSRHAEDVQNRDPRKTGREDIKRTLSRWEHPNTRSQAHSILRTFYDWLMEEGFRKDSPARQVRSPRTRRPSIYRLTREEALAIRAAARPGRERHAIDLMLCAGLRRGELRLLQGRHFRRPGWIWVSSDIAKGRHERWVPVIRDLEPTWRELARLPDHHYVIHSHRFADFLAKQSGERVAQVVLGHARLATTERYLSKPTLEELAAALGHLALSPATPPQSPHEALRATEKLVGSARVLERILASLWCSEVLREAARGMA